MPRFLFQTGSTRGIPWNRWLALSSDHSVLTVPPARGLVAHDLADGLGKTRWMDMEGWMQQRPHVWWPSTWKPANFKGKKRFMSPSEASSHHHHAAALCDSKSLRKGVKVISVQALEVPPEMAEEEVKVVLPEGIRFMDVELLWFFSPPLSLYC